jgi:hypothetical protein
VTDGEVKEWFKFTRPSNGTNSSLTCTLVKGNLSVKFSVKSFSNTVKEGVEEARTGAYKTLKEIEEALGEANTV